MRKLIVVGTLLLALGFSRKAAADCICYGINWQSDYEYATLECLQDTDPCQTPEVIGEDNRVWEIIPIGEWPSGLTELVCDQHTCSECGTAVYDCDNVRPSMRRRLVDTIEGC